MTAEEILILFPIDEGNIVHLVNAKCSVFTRIERDGPYIGFCLMLIETRFNHYNASTQYKIEGFFKSESDAATGGKQVLAYLRRKYKHLKQGGAPFRYCQNGVYKNY